ncbi:hypothetical protein TEA_017873 [Camellia sinensis var. sinensis]|uniref:Uncharacterized protein n=1 Tax=Camellia sinensis var. sinensis TaxID=542762 RepID=A0A4V6RYE2_CAMSN|nr:hypothetical protein TEA_017873 [Camellia sinensis var. sinensis]
MHSRICYFVVHGVVKRVIAVGGRRIASLNIILERLESFQGVLRLNKLQDLNLYPNEFTEFPSLGGLPSLTSLDLASNFLKNSNNFEELTTLSNLEVLKLGNNLITSEIASSIARLTSLKTLSLADNKLNGLWPVERMCKLKNLEELDLSACGLEGKLPPCLCNLTSIRSLELSKNNFNGTIPSTLFFSLKSLEYVSLSENLFEGLFSFSSLANNSILVVFKLASHNNLLRVETEIPRPLPIEFCKLNELRYVDLSHNNIGPTIPPCANMLSLNYLHLQRNDFRETIPIFISKACSLVTLDMRDNKLSGGIPKRITSVSNLRILLLKGNNLDGLIPIHLCQLKNISILDLSHNHFSGSIPPCLKDITFGWRRTLDGPFSIKDQNRSLFVNSYKTQLPIKALDYYLEYYTFYEAEGVGFLTKSRYETYMGNVLYFMSGIDLSCNNLTGQVPSEIGNLSWIITLNLSYNQLTGVIPETFSNLKQIQSLDLSHNRLSGQIPSQLIELTFLSFFKVSYNNLSGRTPQRQAQFATFDKSSYEGNIFLCGEPRRNVVPTLTIMLHRL